MEKKAGKTYKLRQRANLATLLRELRQRAGFSQREVASILNMNRSTYTYYETGKTLPDPMTLNRIAKIFGVPLDSFFLEDEALLTLSDSSVPANRARKKRFNPQHVGDLTTEEREIMAYLRDKELSAEAVLQALRNRFDHMEEE